MDSYFGKSKKLKKDKENDPLSTIKEDKKKRKKKKKKDKDKKKRGKKKKSKS